jgi:diguanylate cyclase (GGDEF)-like protein
MRTTLEGCGRFVPLALLGEGATAQVFKAEDPANGASVALKCLKTLSPEAQLRFEQEYRLQSRLNHPNLCAVHEYGVTADGVPFMTMELVEGVGLDALIPASVAQAQHIFTQLAHALNYMHQQGWIHCDLKPENIRVRSDGTLKLIDFGLLVQAGQRAGTVQGSLHYLSPEIAREQPLDGRSDVYAVGAILYELLSGSKAIEGETVLEVLRNHVNVMPADISCRVAKMPSAFAGTIMRMLSKDPDARPVSILAALANSGVQTDIVYPSMLLAPPLLERETIINQLESALVSVRQGHNGEVLQIQGVAGSGKSRVLSEMRYLASLHGFDVAWVDCAVETGPYGPLVAALRQWLPALEKNAPEALVDAAPYLASLIPELAKDGYTSNLDTEQPQYLIQSALSRVLIKAAMPKGAVMILDGWNNVGTDVQDALRFLIRNGSSLGQMEQATADGKPLAHVPLLVVMASEEELAYSGTRLPLSNLNREAIHRLLASRLGQKELPEAWSQRLMELTAGNPGWLNAILDNAFAQGNLQRAGASWYLQKPFSSTDLSSELRLRLVGRKECLSQEGCQLAEEAAVLGYSWCLSELMDVTNLDTPTMLDALMQLGAAGLITQSPQGYAWQSIAVRDLYYDDIAHEALPELHQRVARLLLKRRVEGHKSSLRQNLELAEHGLMAQMPEAATDWVLTVVSDGFGILPYQDLLVLLRRGLSLLERVEADAEALALRIVYLHWMAHTHRARHELTEAEACLKEGLRLLERRHDPQQECLLSSAYGLVCDLRGDPGDKVIAEEHFARAIELATASDDQAELAYTLVARGRGRLLGGRIIDAIADLEKGYQSALLASKGFQAARALALLGYARVQLGQAADQGCEQVEAAIVEQARLGDHYGESYSLGLLGNIKLEEGHYLDASNAFARQVDIARSLGVIDDLIVGLISLAEAQLGLGQLHDAITNCELAERLAIEHDHVLGKLVACALLGLSHALRAEVPAALKRLAFAEQAALERSSLEQLLGLAYVIDGWLALGLPRRADNTLYQALFTLRAVEAPLMSLRYKLLQARVLIYRGQHGTAGPLLETACQKARQMQNRGLLAMALLERGFVKLHADDERSARDDAETAEAIILDSGAQILALRLKALWAELEARQDNAARARVYYQALELSADDLNMPLTKAVALYGQSQQEDRQPRAKTLLTAAQRLLGDHAAQLDDTLQDDFRQTPWVAAILDAHPTNHNQTALSIGTLSDFGSVVQQMQSTLDSLTNWHESEVAHLNQYQEKLLNLLDGTSRLGVTLDRSDVYQALIGLALRISGAERGYLITKQPGRYGDLICQLALNSDGQPIDTRYSLSVCQRVLANNSPLLLLDTSGDSEFSAAKSILALSIRSVMCVPLGAEDNPNGVLYVDSSAVVIHFSEPDLHLLQILGQHASRLLAQVERHEKLAQRVRELEAGANRIVATSQPVIDDLTKLSGRTHFFDFANREIMLAKRYERPFSLLILTMSNLKHINDHHGRRAGDEALRALGQVLLRQLTEGIIAARLADKEFALLVTLDAPYTAHELLARVLHDVQAVSIADDRGLHLPTIALSAGMTQWQAEDTVIGDMLYRINLPPTGDAH